LKHIGQILKGGVLEKGSKNHCDRLSFLPNVIDLQAQWLPWS